jgi:hypothetical protein
VCWPILFSTYVDALSLSARLAAAAAADGYSLCLCQPSLSCLCRYDHFFCSFLHAFILYLPTSFWCAVLHHSLFDSFLYREWHFVAYMFSSLCSLILPGRYIFCDCILGCSLLPRLYSDSSEGWPLPSVVCIREFSVIQCGILCGNVSALSVHYILLPLGSALFCRVGINGLSWRTAGLQLHMVSGYEPVMQWLCH